MTWRPVLAAQSACVDGPRPEPVSKDRALSVSKDRVLSLSKDMSPTVSEPRYLLLMAISGWSR